MKSLLLHFSLIPVLLLLYSYYYNHRKLYYSYI